MEKKFTRLGADIDKLPGGESGKSFAGLAYLHKVSSNDSGINLTKCCLDGPVSVILDFRFVETAVGLAKAETWKMWCTHDLINSFNNVFLHGAEGPDLGHAIPGGLGPGLSAQSLVPL